MAKRKRKPDGETFRSEVPLTVWPPTLTQHPSAFAQTLNRIWGRGLSILAGAVLMGLGFFVLGGPLGTILGLLGVAMIAAAFAWNWLQRR
ncbi:hypothetical protein D3C87_841890 [compost metagenome]